MTQMMALFIPGIVYSWFEGDSIYPLAAQQQFQNDTPSGVWILLGLALLLLAAGVSIWVKSTQNPGWFLKKITAIKNALSGNAQIDILDEKTLDEAIRTAGYAYDPAQDIFYSRIDAWQRNMGYCRLYDEACATFGMIVDCEPIYFEYNGRKWLIEFWKGQYDLTTGCEIGIYVADDVDPNNETTFTGTFYQCAGNEDLIDMYCSLSKNQRVMFQRKDKHWWLTGFKVGEFSEPSELVMNISVTLKNKMMRDAFMQGLLAAGYMENEIKVSGNRVSLTFDQPKTQQPITRTRTMDELTQRKNELLCESYQSITGPYQSFPEKINAIQKQAPWLYKKVLNLGKGEQFLQIYQKIKGE